MADTAPPPGFTLDEPQKKAAPPAGFSVDEPRQSTLSMAPRQDTGSVAGALWKGLLRGIGETAHGTEQLALRTPNPITALTGLGREGQQRTLGGLERDIATQRQRAEADPQARAHPIASGVGHFAGEALSTAPLMALPAGGATTGGRMAMGALGGAAGAATAPVEGNDYWTQKSKQIGAGAAIGAAIPGVLGRSPAAPAAEAAGMTLSPGQAAGGGWRQLEQTLRAYPIVGAMVRGTEARTLDSFQRAAVNQALEPIGVTVPRNLRPQHGLVEYATDRFNDTYDRVLRDVTLRADSVFHAEIAHLKDLVSDMPPEMVSQFNRIVENRVFRRFGPEPPAPGRSTHTPATDELGSVLGLDTKLPAPYHAPRELNIDGKTLKQVESELGNFAATYRQSSDAAQRQLGIAVSELQHVLKDTLARQNPQRADELRNIDAAYSMFARIRDASSRGKEGEFTPAQLRQASRRQDISVGKGDSARGTAVMRSIAEIGEKVMGPQRDPHVVHGLVHELWRLTTGAAAALPYVGAVAAERAGLSPAIARGAQRSSPSAGREAGNRFRKGDPGPQGGTVEGVQRAP